VAASPIRSLIRSLLTGLLLCLTGLLAHTAPLPIDFRCDAAADESDIKITISS
jgi:hypothetical protein